MSSVFQSSDEYHSSPRTGTVNLPNDQGSWQKKNASGAGGSLSRTKNRSGTRCAHQFWPQGARSAASALARSHRNGRLPARAHASIKIRARIQSEFRIQIMHARILNSACTRGAGWPPVTAVSVLKIIFWNFFRPVPDQIYSCSSGQTENFTGKFPVTKSP